jgi:tRNA A-37 threonylcarbamoyl transferase component Bud32
MSTHKPGVLADRYTLDRVIGRGGMADVYQATDHLLEREVAVKVLRTHTATELDRRRFETEARTLAQFDHPHLVSVLDAGINDDVPYLVMDLVDGRSLAALCAGGPLPERQVAVVGAALAEVLAYVHAHGVVHRDLKPGNVLVGSDGVVRLADFGIARLLGDPGGQTATGTLVGTAAYLAPEQVRGDPIGPAADLYSLGLLLLEALSGERAYTGTPTEAALARLHAPPPMPASLPQGWVRLLEAMTDRDPARRPSAVRVGRALRELAEPGGAERCARHIDVSPAYVDEPSREAEVPAGRSTGRLRSRKAWFVAAAVVVLLASVAGAGLLTLGGHKPTAAATAASHLPPGTPDRLRQPLQELHDAAGTGPAVSGPLARVDAAVLARRWDEARTRLDQLVRATMHARDVGTLTTGKADAVQAAAARLAVDLPGPQPGGDAAGDEDQG